MSTDPTGVRRFSASGVFPDTNVTYETKGLWHLESRKSMGSWTFHLEQGIFIITITITFGNPSAQSVMDAVSHEIDCRLIEDGIL